MLAFSLKAFPRASVRGLEGPRAGEPEEGASEAATRGAGGVCGHVGKSIPVIKGPTHLFGNLFACFGWSGGHFVAETSRNVG